jgi:CHAD domain-containing protein
MADLKRARWISGTTPDDPTCDVARRALQARLAAVLQYLPAAAEHGEGEQVHQLRVATRRAAATLDLFADLLPKRSSEWLGEKLKRIRRAAGEARDLDVLHQRLEKKHADVTKDHLLEHLRERRQKAQRRVRAVHRSLARKGRLARRLDKLLRCLRFRGREGDGPWSETFGDWARLRLRPVLERFFQATPAPDADVEALHQLRIRGKELRYVMELLAGAFPASFRDRDYPVVELLQDRLGTINDHATALVRLRRRLKKAEGPEKEDLHTLLDREAVDLEQARREFLAWWTPLRQAELRRRLEEALEDHHAVVLA